MRAFVRTLYRLALHLHPRAFRAEFGDEMLWIFDEQSHSGETGLAQLIIDVELFLDAMRSALIQHLLREPSRPRRPRPHFDLLDHSGRVVQMAHGGFITLNCLFLVFMIVFCLHMVIASL